MKRLCIWLLAAVVSVGAFADVNEGDALPSFRLPTLDGRVLDSKALAGRVVYIDFWASWCTTCRKSFPDLNALHAELKSKGVVFIGINTDEDPELAQRFLSTTPADFLILSDQSQKVVGAFNPTGFPTAYIIDKTGTVHTVETGFAGKSAVRDLLVSLL